MITRTDMERRIPSGGERYDVIVAGGGPAGMGAALGAAMNGARTLLLEERSFFGGVATVGLWMPVNRLVTDGQPRGGVHDLFVETIKKYGPDASVEGKRDFINGDGLDIHPDYLRLALFEMLEHVGCDYRLYSPATGVLMEGRTVQGVVTTHKGLINEFPAAVVVDATGDGDVAYLAGAEIMEGRENDGTHMPVSLVFAVAGADTDRFFRYREEHRKDLDALFDEAEEQGYATAVWYGFDRTTVPGVVSVNNGAMRALGSIDASQARDLTVAERAGARVAVDFVRIARDKRIPGLEDCHLIRTGAAVGVRDTRRVVGEYVQTEEDALEGARFDDAVSRKFGAIDACQLGTGPMRSGFHYPYRSLLPKGVEGLLMAGRCASANFMGHAAGKSMGNMMGLGQAAGVAAALCSRSGQTPREIDVAKVQEMLIRMGVDLAL